jgi:hypothetical protein
VDVPNSAAVVVHEGERGKRIPESTRLSFFEKRDLKEVVVTPGGAERDLELSPRPFEHRRQLLVFFNLKRDLLAVLPRLVTSIDGLDWLAARLSEITDGGDGHLIRHARESKTTKGG